MFVAAPVRNRCIPMRSGISIWLSGWTTYLRFFADRRVFVFFREGLDFFGFSVAASSRRFLEAQPGLLA